MKTIVFCDVDGTLLNSERKVSSLTLRAIDALRQQGIPFVITSGRSPAGIYSVSDAYGLNCPIIACGGALIIDENRRTLFSQSLPMPLVESILSFADSCPYSICWSIHTASRWIVRDRTDPRVSHEEAIVQIRAIEGGLETVDGEDVIKLMMTCHPEDMPKVEPLLRTSFSGCSIVKASNFFFEIMCEGITKEATVRRLCEMWGVDPADAIAFGDNFNDAGMLSAVGHGFLMGNASPAMKKLVSLHALDNDHDGIFHALSGMGLLRL